MDIENLKKIIDEQFENINEITYETKGSIRDLREIFNEGEYVSALITEIDLEKGRIGLNTALLEDTPGELLIEKQKVMNDAEKRALKTKGLFDQESKNNE